MTANLILKWGNVKGWEGFEEGTPAWDALGKWCDSGQCLSAMQRQTPEQRELICEIIDAVEAGRLGLCNHVVPGPHLEPKLQEVIAKLKELSGTSLEFARRAMDLGRGRTLDEALTEQENIYLHELMKTADANEGIKAFMEKRKPVWRHR